MCPWKCTAEGNHIDFKCEVVQIGLCPRVTQLTNEEDCEQSSIPNEVGGRPPHPPLWKKVYGRDKMEEGLREKENS